MFSLFIIPLCEKVKKRVGESLGFCRKLRWKVLPGHFKNKRVICIIRDVHAWALVYRKEIYMEKILAMILLLQVVMLIQIMRGLHIEVAKSCGMIADRGHNSNHSM